MAENKLDPRQVKGLIELIKRVEYLEMENKAFRCLIRGAFKKYLGNVVPEAARDAANKLPDVDRHEVKRILDELMKPD